MQHVTTIVTSKAHGLPPTSCSSEPKLYKESTAQHACRGVHTNPHCHFRRAVSWHPLLHRASLVHFLLVPTKVCLGKHVRHILQPLRLRGLRFGTLRQRDTLVENGIVVICIFCSFPSQHSFFSWKMDIHRLEPGPGQHQEPWTSVAEHRDASLSRLQAPSYLMSFDCSGVHLFVVLGKMVSSGYRVGPSERRQVCPWVFGCV